MPASSDDRALLVYETDDSGFADFAIDALTRAGIDCYRTGGALPGGSSLTVCIYIRNASDLHRANEILVQQGAAVDAPTRISRKWLVTGIIIGALLVALIFVEFSK